jgi:hypothetical protein
LKIETEGYFSKLENCITRVSTLNLELTYPLKALGLKHPPTWPQAYTQQPQIQEKVPVSCVLFLAEFCFKMARKRVLFGVFSHQISKKNFVSKRVPEFISILIVSQKYRRIFFLNSLFIFLIAKFGYLCQCLERGK